MNEPLTEAKKRYISITPKDSELIIVNTGNDVKEVFSWGLAYLSPNDVESAVRGLVDEICTAWSIEHQDECAEMLEYMEKWFPALFKDKGEHQINEV